MNKKYLLPALKNETRIISDYCWENIDEIYDFLLDNMKLYYEPSGSVFDEGSNAMPHLFEQMLLFHNIFFDKKHPEHDRAVVEWRAALSILALQRIRNIRVDAIKIELDEDSNNPFILAAASFRPEDMPALYKTTWDYIYVFRMDGIPFAITSPLSIICPAKMFKKKISKLDWIVIETVNQKTNLLFDFRGRGNEYADLGDWLKLLNSNIVCMNSADGEVFLRYEKVKKELETFIELYSREADLEVETFNKKKIYESMNNNIRKEYDFLNNCSDFYLADANMNFLVERYHDDIFQQKLLVIVYDDKPDAMINTENLEKLATLFHHVLKIGYRSIISVIEPGGEPLSAYALLPFKKNFIQEMIEKHITAEDFFDEYTVIYDYIKDRFEVRLNIKNFPYSFYKIYSYDDCQLLYGKDFVSTYLWPDKRINMLNWRHYYTWVYEKGSDIKVDIPYAVSSVEYQSKKGGNTGDIVFHLLRTSDFPPYIRYSLGAVSGYIPISSENTGMDDFGGTMGIFVDIGHTSTYVTMLKIYDISTRKSVERVAFRVPGSINITGDKNKELLVDGNFVIEESDCKKQILSYFRNVIHSFYSYKKIPNSYSVNPFEDGQVLFYMKSCVKMLGDDTLHFLDFDYDKMKQQQKRHAHIFVQQILLFAIHTAILKQCSYIKVRFLHPYDDENERLGQLEGLWKHAMQFGERWTGISESMDNPILSMSEQKALTGNLFRNLTLRDESMEKLLNKDSKKVFASVDIGWKKTLVTHIYSNEKDELQKKYTKIAFGGYDISMINNEYNFQRYDEIIGIFLTGSRKIDENTIEGKLLKELRSNCKPEPDMCASYYYGLFDLIAMQVEKNNYVIPSDVYNKMDEFRGFIKMMTYNISLLFLNIGYILGCMQKSNKNKEAKELHIYAGGNGTKFLRWISNIKDYNCINSENNDKIFIVGMGEYTILDVLKKGFEIGSNCKCLNAVIYLEHDMKEEMVNGYIFQETPGFYDFNEEMPDLTPDRIKNNFGGTDLGPEESGDESTNQNNNEQSDESISQNDNEQSDESISQNDNEQSDRNNDDIDGSDSTNTEEIVSEKQQFYETMDQLRQAVFGSEYGISASNNGNYQKIEDISQIICANSCAVCGNIINVINNMRNNDDN